MTVLSSIARFILVTDAKLQQAIGNFFVQRSAQVRSAAVQDKQAADYALTAELATIEMNHRKELAALTARLASHRLDAQDRAQARRDITVNDAIDEIVLADSIEQLGSKRLVHANKLHMAIGYMEGP